MQLSMWLARPGQINQNMAREWSLKLARVRDENANERSAIVLRKCGESRESLELRSDVARDMRSTRTRSGSWFSGSNSSDFQSRQGPTFVADFSFPQFDGLRGSP